MGEREFLTSACGQKKLAIEGLPRLRRLTFIFEINLSSQFLLQFDARKKRPPRRSNSSSESGSLSLPEKCEI